MVEEAKATVRDILSAPIPLSVVLFLIMQTTGFVWWGSTQINIISARISALEMITIQMDKSMQARNSHEGRIIVLEQMAQRVRDDLSEIKVLIRGQQQEPKGGGR